MTLRNWFYFFGIGAFIGLLAACLSVLLIPIFGIDVAQAAIFASSLIFWISALCMSAIYITMRRRGLC
jgi:uncharacterized membrane protein